MIGLAREVVPVISGAALLIVSLLFAHVNFELNRGDTQPIGERGHRRVLRLGSMLLALNVVALVVVAGFSVPGLEDLIAGDPVRGRYVIGLSIAGALLVFGLPLAWSRRRRAKDNLIAFLRLQGR